MQEHETRRVPVEKLCPAEYNPRTITEQALDGLRKSLEEFGLVQPIVWNERTGNVVGGHQRLKLIAEAGFTEIEVVVVDLDETRERALNVTLNNQHIAGDFSDDLNDVLTSIEEGDPDLMVTLGLGELYLPELTDNGGGSEGEQLSGEPQQLDPVFEVTVSFETEEDQVAFAREMEERGVECRLLTL